MYRIFITVALLWSTLAAQSAEFDKLFADTTVRVDFTIEAKPMSVTLDAISCTQHWHGRRVNLSKLAFSGFMCYALIDAASGDTIYQDSKYADFTDYSPTREVIALPLPRRDVWLVVSPFGMWGHPAVRRYLHAQALAQAPMRQPRSRCVTLQKAATSNAVSVAFVAEGYTEGELDSFMDAAQRMQQALFGHPAFAANRDKFNVVAVPLASPQSGISRPSQQTSVATAFNSHFDSYGMERLLTIPSPRALADSLQGLPATHVIVLANTDKYGGSGSYNAYCIGFANGDWSPQVVVHEFGHSFANLADEYDEGYEDYYQPNIEPEEQNITTQHHFEGKWQNLIDAGAASFIEGGGYQKKGVWRGCEQCLMRAVADINFCAVCDQAITRHIAYLTTE